MKIGAIAKEAEVGVETIRFYEREGLLRKPSKPAGGGYREYSPEDLTRLKFIKRVQELGFTLREIKDLLILTTKPNATCSDVRRVSEAKISEIEAKIADLNKMKESLVELVCACGIGKKAVSNCKIVNCFEPNCNC